MKYVDRLHTVGLEVHAPGSATRPTEAWDAVTLDGKPLRGVKNVEVHTPVDGVPRVTITLDVKAIRGVEAPAYDADAALRKAIAKVESHLTWDVLPRLCKLEHAVGVDGGAEEKEEA